MFSKCLLRVLEFRGSRFPRSLLKHFFSPTDADIFSFSKIASHFGYQFFFFWICDYNLIKNFMSFWEVNRKFQIMFECFLIQKLDFHSQKGYKT